MAAACRSVALARQRRPGDRAHLRRAQPGSSGPVVRLLDTDVCIEILRGNQTLIERRLATPDDVATSWITACELACGAAKSARPKQNQKLVDGFLATVAVHGLDRNAAGHFGGLKARLERTGRTLADADLLIAAIALAQQAVLVTGNRRHYERIPGLRMEDWMHGTTNDER